MQQTTQPDERDALCGVVEPGEWPAHEFRAMGSRMSVRLALPAHAARGHFAAVERAFAEAEARLSRFDAQSEVSRLNARAGAWCAVSPQLWDLLDTALTMAGETGGLFDPTMLAAIRASGYRHSFADWVEQGDTPSQEQHLVREGGDLSLRGRWQAVRRRPPSSAATGELWLPLGVGLDFGGIAKGVVAAQVVEQLRPFGPCLVDAGGDLVAGAAPPGWPGWPVAIAAPAPTGADIEPQDLALIWLRDAALATSGIDYRRWQHQGQVAHHILDPRSGRPAETDLVTVTVIATSAARAEAWAKAALVLGLEAGYRVLQAQQLGALLVHRDGSVVMTPALYKVCAA